MKKVGIVSCDKWIGKLEEDNNLKNALINLGIDAKIISWQQPLEENYDLLVLKSVWGYQNFYKEFKNWLLYVKNNNIPLVIDTLNEAIAKEKDVHGLIIHSDQGFQYTSFQYKAICESNSITISMGRKGTPLDDAPIESWHALLKKETLYNNNITSLQEYQKLVEEWILFYNTKRIKSKKSGN